MKMNYKFKIIILFILIEVVLNIKGICNIIYAYTDEDFVMEWKIPMDGNGITGEGTTIAIPIPKNSSNKYSIEWGDGTIDTYNNAIDFPTHTYKPTEETNYQIVISGNIDIFGYNGTSKPTATNVFKDYYTMTEYLTYIKQWGKINATRFGFAYCENLQGSIPESTGFEKLNSTENMFLNCASLTDTISSNFLAKATEIISVKNMFSNCINLKGSIPSDLFKNNNKITTFENTFANCSSLTGAIPGTLFENATIAENYAGTFNGCTSLEGEIPESLFANSSMVKTFSETFANCTGLISPTAGTDGIVSAVPSDLFINNKFVLNYYRTFYNCSSLSGIVSRDIFRNNQVINSITEDSSLKSNFTGTFENCTSIESVNLDSSVVGHQMFKNCTSIKNINIDNAVDIGTEAFYGCNVLDNITISDNNLISIGTDAFEYTGTNPDKLFTYINRENEMLLNYDWEADNRIIDTTPPRGRVEIVTEKYPFTNTQEIELKITLLDDTLPENCEIAILNENEYNLFIASDNQDYNTLVWSAYKENENWTLTANDGIKTVYVLLRDQYGNVSEIKKDLY